MTEKAHGHGHSHGAHTRGVGESRLGIAALLTGTFMVAEVVGGIIAGSLALLADAGHMVTDFASLGLAWYAFRLARRPADWRRTYGYDRFTTLAAFVNGLALFVVAAWILIEAIHRLDEPRPVLGGVMLWVASAGLAINVLSFWVLHGGDRGNLNIRAASLHVLGDLLGSVAAVAAAVTILLTGWTPIDPLLSILVAVIILRSGWSVVRDSGQILLEGAPEGADSREIAADLVANVTGLDDVHHVHVWSITENRHMVTLHARVSGPLAADAAVSDIKRRLRERFGIPHATVEVEVEGCADEE